MRTFTTSCLAILLLSAIASARLGDTAVTASMPTSNTTAVPSATDVNNFLSGVWEAIGLGHDFDDFSTCVQEGNNAGTQLKKAMTMMNSSSASDVSNGLNKLDKVVQPLVAGLKSCNMTDKYTKTINQIINKFTGADQLNIVAGSSILIDGIEVYSDVAAAITACNKSDYVSCGTSLGNAMGRVFYSSENVTSSEVADEINATPNITWTAADISEFYGLNLWQFKKSRLTLRRKKNASANSSDTSAEEDNRRNLATIPTTFDARNNWPNCIHPIRDQMNCGSCWAFGASEVLSDRFCIASNQTINTVMSPQYLVSCDSRESACNGGYINYAWKFLETSGDVSDTCWPYQSGNYFVPSCSTFTKCKDNSQMRKYYAKVNSSKAFTTPTAIQNEIITNGPVEAGMDVYSDFMNYRSGIYSTTSRATYLGGHAVKIVGWGTSNGIKYWIVANSWGTYWGESGFFRIKFGSCSIDRGCYAGLPDLTRS